MMLSWFEIMTAGQAIILVTTASCKGSSGPSGCEDSMVMFGACVGCCASAGFVYGACSYFNVNVCGGMVDGSGNGSFGFGYG